MSRRTLVVRWAAHTLFQDQCQRWAESWVVWRQMVGQWSVDMQEATR